MRRRRPRVLLLPGFGGSPAQPILLQLEARLVALGLRCERLAPPRGRPAPDLARELAWLEAAVDAGPGSVALVGRSFGARLCARFAVGRPVVACVLLGFPLRPPGRPRPLDEAALGALRCPTLLVQGSRDPLGPLPLVRRVVRANPAITLAVLPGATHAFGRAQGPALDQAAQWLGQRLGARSQVA